MNGFDYITCMSRQNEMVVIIVGLFFPVFSFTSFTVVGAY